jgi:hypothetical protein
MPDGPFGPRDAYRTCHDDVMDLTIAAAKLADWGFLAAPDLPDRPGPAYLLVALREHPTLRHYDPEIVEYWVTSNGRGKRSTLAYHDPMPIELDFSWGLIRIVDRLAVSNEYLTFGGHLSAASIDGATVAAFSSPVPLLRRGGHSQIWDVGAQDLGAFFGRLMVAVDYSPGFEAKVAESEPITRYAAFVADVTDRYRRSDQLRLARGDLWRLLQVEEVRLRRDAPEAWAAGQALRATAGIRA